jgi:hypothetical protein
MLHLVTHELAGHPAYMVHPATDRLAAMAEGLDWIVEYTYAAQIMCPYETVAYGYSRFCELFTYDEWVGFEYSVDCKSFDPSPPPPPMNPLFAG